MFEGARADAELGAVAAPFGAELGALAVPFGAVALLFGADAECRGVAAELGAVLAPLAGVRGGCFDSLGFGAAPPLGAWDFFVRPCGLNCADATLAWSALASATAAVSIRGRIVRA